MAARRSYTKEQREAVLADVPVLGVSAAARKHGVPQTTLTKWAQVAGARREVEPSPSTTPTAKTRARKSKEGARPRRKRKEPAQQVAAEQAAEQAEQAKVAPTVEAKREEPAATTQPPVRRPLKKRAAMIYTPSQKAEILEHAATHG